MLSRMESNKGARACAAAAPDPLESSNAAIAHFTERVDGIALGQRQSFTGRFRQNS